MPRFFVSTPIGQEEIVISGQEARHIQRVLRLRVGDRIDLFDGTGKEFRGRITQQDRQAVTVRILTTIRSQCESPLRVFMGQSLIKGEKIEFVIQKATELGVSELIPFFSSRSVTRPDERKMKQRVERWRRIAVASSKQCGRVIPMKIETAISFADALRRFPVGVQRMILWEGGTRRLKPLLKKGGLTASPSQNVYFLVGPEGGFSDDEVRQAEEAQFTPMRLGTRVLRTETAGLTFVSILQYEWGDLG